MNRMTNCVPRVTFDRGTRIVPDRDGVKNVHSSKICKKDVTDRQDDRQTHLELSNRHKKENDDKNI